MNAIITRKQIRDLSTAAGAHGDLEMVAICDLLDALARRRAKRAGA